MVLIQKRNGDIIEFDKEKIITAINKAFIEVDKQLYEDDTAKDIADEIYLVALANPTPLTVEIIQDLVEQFLMASERPDVAKAYIRYRYKREAARNSQNDFIEALKAKIEATDVENQNANVDERSFGGRIGAASDLQMKKYALEYCVSPMARRNHENNEIYIHDLNAYPVGSHNCLSIPFDKLLAEGFNTRQTDVRPAGSVNTAFQLVAVIFQLQSLQQFGGVSSTHLDWTMVPYVRKSFAKHYRDGWQYIEGKAIDEMDYEIRNMLENVVNYSIEDVEWKAYNERVYNYALAMTKKETHQAAEGLAHNLNTLQSRSGNQLPFTSINYGTCTLIEGRMVIKALLDVSIEGLGKLHKTSIFPCGIFQCMKGVNRKPGEPNYDLYRLALKSTALRLYPNYANVDWSVNAGYDPADPKTYFSTMGCRTSNGADINADPGTNPQTKDGRGNCCPVTIILPTIAMEAEELADTYTEKSEDKTIAIFMELLDKKIHEAKDMLIERYEYICSQPIESAKFMYENGLGIGFDGKTVRSVMKHFTLVIGQLGLAEALQILIGTDHTTPEGMELAKKIEQLFKTRCAEFKQQEHLNFGVYFTPAENLAYTALKAFRKRYGIIPNVSDREYFTNSINKIVA